MKRGRKKKVKSQKDIVLSYFKKHPKKNFTSERIWDVLWESDIALLSSIKRTITELTKEGKLIKCNYEERIIGGWGKPNRTWRYNTEYVNPLNPKK